MGTGASAIRTAAVFFILLSFFLSLPATAQARDPWHGALHRDHPRVQAAMEVQKKFTGALMADRDIAGTAIGADAEGLPVMRVYAKRHGVAGIPDRLESLRVEVHVTGMIVALGNTTVRYRPAPIGVSTGHFAITAGTIGARVKDAAGNVYALSNNHVYANSNNASLGDAVLQPGPYDGGKDPADRLGELFNYVPLDFSYAGRNYVDAAIAAPPNPADLGNATLADGYGVPGTSVQEASIGMPVKKYGRTTSLTHGTVAEIHATVQVCYATFYNFCIQSANFYDQIAISPGTFSAGGDSGSLIVTDDASNSPVGLLFAGGSDRTFANRIALVLSAFNVTIDGGTSGNMPPSAAFTAATSGLTATFTDQSTDADGTIKSWSWNFGDGGSAAEQNPTHAYAAAGTYTVTLTVTDDDRATGTTSRQVAVTDPNKSVHIGDLDGSKSRSFFSWKATVTATVHNQGHTAAGGATVTGTWSGGAGGSCKTGKNGTCSITRSGISNGTASVTFTVTGVSLSGYTYSAASNHDTDGGSNGTVITITRP